MVTVLRGTATSGSTDATPGVCASCAACDGVSTAVNPFTAYR